MQKLGRYEIVGQLGRGSVGTVYKAWDPMMGRDVAIKTIQGPAIEGPQSAEVRKRLFQEAKAAGKLAHSGIVTVFDVSEHEGMPFLVMEYVEGHTLQTLIQNNVRLDLDCVCDLGIQLAEALDYAHRNGVIHRDVKPANILVTKNNRTKIADFGVAKLIESSVTSTGLLLGTPAFMAPEQFTGQPIDGRADLFATAAVIYCMATGDRPFTGDTVLSVQYKVVQMTPVPPRRLNPAIAPGLEAVILKGIEKDPSRRYQSGEELAADLRATRAGRLVKAGARSFESKSAAEVVPSGAPAASEVQNNSSDRTELLTHPPETTESSAIPSDPHPSRMGLRSRAAVRMLVFTALVVGFFALMTFALVKPPKVLPVLLNTVDVPPISDPPPTQASEEIAKEEETPPVQRTEASPAVVEPAKPALINEVVNQAAPQKTGVPAKRSPVTSETLTRALLPVAETNEKGPAPVEPSSLAHQFETSRLNGSQLPLPKTHIPIRQAPRVPAGPPTDSAQLLISSLDLPDSLTLIVTMDNEVLLRDYNSPASSKVVPLAEMRSLPPGQHRLQVNVMQGARRVGQPQEITGRFYAGQRRTLQIIFESEQHSGRDARNPPHFTLTLR
jgi:serine/threonine protein kinase